LNESIKPPDVSSGALEIFVGLI